jgi:thiol-disulfide isomerase/thioredoxin
MKTLNFYTTYFLMGALKTIGITVVIFVIVVLAYRMYAGYYPGSKLIITDPPISHNGLEDKQARFMFFYTTWCPWCRKAQDPWAKFKQQLKNTPVTYGGYTILFEDVNAESDKGKAALYSIKAYPTFKVETLTKVYEMKGTPDPLTFDAFLVAALGKKVSH